MLKLIFKKVGDVCSFKLEILSNQDEKMEEIMFIPSKTQSLFLLNSLGEIEKKLEFVSLPADYVIPEGQFVSLQIKNLSQINLPEVPQSAFFYFGNSTFGEVSCKTSSRFFADFTLTTSVLTIKIQGNVAKDTNKLRDYILQLIHNKTAWQVRNIVVL